MSPPPSLVARAPPTSPSLSGVALAFLLLAAPLLLLAVLMNGLAFLVFYKKPIFRKILSNR